MSGRRVRLHGGWGRAALAATVAALVAGCGASGAGGTGKALPASNGQMAQQVQAGCIHSPVQVKMMGVETVPCKTESHVAEGKAVTYETDPPLSGDHWSSWLPPGFYTVAQAPEQLVHDLEHGNIVIYYDKDRLSADDLAKVKALTQQFRQDFQGVLAVPRADKQAALILTAWEHALRLNSYAPDAVDQFVDAFRGRGPEKAVR